MAEPPAENDNPMAARIVGIVYLTFCAGVGGGVPLFWHPASIYCRMAFGSALLVGLIAAVVAGIKDPAARPIRWGLLWLAVGFITGPVFVLGSLYLLLRG